MSYHVRLLLALAAALGFAFTAHAQDDGGTLTVNGGNNGVGSITVAAPIVGTLTLNGANTYQGGTTINSGTISFGSGTTIMTSGTITVSGGVLTVSGNTNYVSFGGTTFTNSGTLTFDLGIPPQTTAGTLSLNSPYLYSGGTVSLVAPAAGLTLYSGTSTLNVAGGVAIQVGNAITVESAPEPSAILMALVAVAGFFVLRRRAQLGR